ncbi:MAG: sodium/proton-translocating pyrophosphatase, partial [Flavobacteriales bacterium]|nr:sodium/proton-translocating pyrophosphatase [Flavobacteriales bacterium]
TQDISSMRVFYACLVGLVVGAGISAFTEYYTGLGSKPILKIVQQSSTGAGTNIIAGLATGMISTFSSVLLFAAAIWTSYALAGFYGVALAASAMMATTAMQLAIDAFGPIADNAGGIAEMSKQEPIVRERTDILDAVGNTTAATGKGFAIASAALTSLALFAAYVTFTGIDGINIFKAPVLAMLFVGGMIPVVFSALAMNAVGKAAMEMVEEVRRQFREIPGIMEGTGKPDYAKCIDISTKASLKEMMLPGILTIGFPIAVILIGKLVYPDNNMLVAEMLGGYMAGVTVSGVLWAIFQNNAGGAWDNAKKSFEAGVEINGEMTYKGSPAHEAAITGDTVGDPFKDTSGPSMNILIKLTCLIGLVVAPILGEHSSEAHTIEEVQTETAIQYDEYGNEITKEATAIATPDLNELQGEWLLDGSHTYVDFSLRHILATSKGNFQKVSGALIISDTTKSMSIVIDVNSINTGNQDRDDHLKSDEMFNAEQYPTITFKSEDITKTASGYLAKGQLTVMAVTKDVELPFEYFGKQDTPWGFPSAAFAGEITINKNDYGLTYGGSMLGEDVKIDFAIVLNPPYAAEEATVD